MLTLWWTCLLVGSNSLMLLFIILKLLVGPNSVVHCFIVLIIAGLNSVMN